MKKMVFLLLVTIIYAVPAYSQMMDKPMIGKGVSCGQMMTMCDIDGMGDMDQCLEHADKLGLTDEQLKKITPIHREMKKKHIRFKADLQIAELEDIELREVKDFDLEKAIASVKKIADLKVAHQMDMLKSMKEVRSILNEEQFQKMKKMVPRMMGEKKPIKHMKQKR